MQVYLGIHPCGKGILTLDLFHFLSKISLSDSEEAIGDSVKQLVYQLCKQKEQVEVLELNVQADHGHPVVEIPLKYAVSEFDGYLKGRMALRLFQQYEGPGRRYGGVTCGPEVIVAERLD